MTIYNNCRIYPLKKNRTPSLIGRRFISFYNLIIYKKNRLHIIRTLQPSNYLFKYLFQKKNLFFFGLILQTKINFCSE